MNNKRINKKITLLVLVLIVGLGCVFASLTRQQKKAKNSMTSEAVVQTTEQQVVKRNNIREELKLDDQNVLLCEEDLDNNLSNSEELDNAQKDNNFEIPTKDSIEKWKEDGSWEDRVAFYESLPHDVSPNLIQNLQTSGLDGEVELGEIKGNTASMPSTGDVKTLVITCDFDGMRYKDAINDKVNQWFNGKEDATSWAYPYESVSAYYYRSSFGKLRLSSEIFEYHSEHTRDYYYDEENNYDLIPEVIDSYIESIKSSYEGTESEKENYLNEYLKQFDSNDDGLIDGVYFVFPGETTGWGSLWWPHVNYYNGYEIGDYTFGSVCWQMAQYVGGLSTSSDYYSYDTTAIIHETGHMLGLPDLYSYNDSGIGTLSFDIMDTNLGDHNGFFKMLLGWIDVDEIPIITEGAANVIQLKGYSKTGDVAIVIPEYNVSEGLYTEFYMIEYYESYGNDRILELDSYDGLRIYHINAKLEETKTNFVVNNTFCKENNTTPLISAYDKDVCGEKNLHTSLSTDARGGGWLMYGNWGEGDYGCIYYDGDELTPYTSPSSYRYDDNNSYYGCEYSGFFINNINIENGVATFTTGFEMEKEAPEMEYEIYESGADGYNSRFNLRIYFNTEIRLKDYDMENTDAYIVNGDGENVASVNMKLYDYRPYNYITFTMDDSSVIDEREDNYTVIIPEGNILSTYGTSNTEIRIPYNTKKEYPIENFAQATLEDFETKTYSSDVDEYGNGVYFVGDRITTWNEELSKFDDPYDQYIIEPANYSMYVVNNFTCSEMITVDVTPVEKEQYMHLYSVKFLGDGKYGICWQSVIDSQLLFRVIDSKGQVMNERLVDVSGCVTYGIVGNEVWIVYEDNYVICDFEGKKEDIKIDIPDIEETPTWFIMSGDVMIVRCLLDDGNEKEYIIKDGKIVYVDEGREGDFGKSRAVDIKKIGDYYYYNTELLTREGVSSEYAQYVDVFDEDFNKIESYKLENVLHSYGVYGTSCGFVVYTGSSLALYDKNFNYVKTLDISAPYFRTSIDSNNITFVDTAESTITTKRITLSDLTREIDDNAIALPNGIGNVDNNKIILSEHLKQEQFISQFEADLFIVSFGTESEYVHEGDIISIGYVDERHTKYYKVIFENMTHEYGEWENDGVDIETDTHTKKCLVCKESVSEPHKWNDGEVTTASTCTSEGEKTYMCTDCTATKTEKVEALGHVFSEVWTVDKEASCIDTGSKSYHCTRQNCTEKSNITVIPRAEHVWNAEEVTETGEQVYTCANCPSTKIGDVITVGHKYSDEWTVDKEATCTEEGSKSRHCTTEGCSEKTEVTVIPATGKHTYDEGVIQKLPSCVDKGTKVYTCTICKQTKTEEIVATGNHVYGDWEETKAPTVDETGEKARTCTTCAHQETEVIAAIGHVKGATFEKGNAEYTIDTVKGKKGTVIYEGSTKENAKKVTIPATVTIDGKKYTVTEVADNAFKGNTKVKEVTVSKNITKIGKNAFSGCKNLKKITIKSTKLTSVGKNAIKGINKKSTIKVPKQQLKKYKKLFKSKTGYKKTMKIKK